MSDRRHDGHGRLRLEDLPVAMVNLDPELLADAVDLIHAAANGSNDDVGRILGRHSQADYIGVLGGLLLGFATVVAADLERDAGELLDDVVDKIRERAES